MNKSLQSLNHNDTMVKAKNLMSKNQKTDKI